MAHLDDNARTGLHALALGALIIGVPVLVVQLVDASQTAVDSTGASVLRIFRNGYLLPMGGPELTCDSTTRMERIGLAAVMAMVAGLCLGLLALPLRKRALPWAVGRWGAFIVLLFLCWCALTTPVCSARLSGDGIRYVERPRLLGAIGLPWASTERVLNTNGASIRTEPEGMYRTRIILARGKDRTTIAITAAEGQAVEAAVDHLERVLHTAP